MRDVLLRLVLEMGVGLLLLWRLIRASPHGRWDRKSRPELALALLLSFLAVSLVRFLWLRQLPWQ